MRTSRFALASCTALLGLGTLVSQAIPAAAGPSPKQGTIVLDQGGNTIDDFMPAPPTTKPAPKPNVGDFQIVNPPIVDPDLPEMPDLPELPGAEVNDSSQDEDPCTPVPGGPNCPDEEPCRPDSTVPGTPDEQCPPEDDCPPPTAATAQIPPGDDCDDPCEERPNNPTPRDRGDDCDDPCDPGDVIARHHPDPCDPCEPEGTDDGPIARGRDERCDDPCVPEGGTDGGPTRSRDDSREDCPGTGTDGGGDLPKTGGDVVTLLGAGLGLTGLGAALRRLARR